MYEYTGTPNYSLLSPYNPTCMCVFRGDRLALNNQLVCSSTSPDPRFPQLLIVLWVRLRPCGLFPIHFGMPTGIFVQLTSRQSHSETSQTWLLTLLRDTISQANCLILWPLTIISLPLLSLWFGYCFVGISIGTGLHNSVLWLIIVFYNGLCLLQREVSLTRVEDHAYLWYKVQVFLDCC